jgi:hypothetical protein
MKGMTINISAAHTDVSALAVGASGGGRARIISGVSFVVDPF